MLPKIGAERGNIKSIEGVIVRPSEPRRQPWVVARYSLSGYTLGHIDDPEVRVGVAPSRQGTIHTGASWMWLARYSAAASQPLALAGSGLRGCFTRPIPWGDLLIPGPLVQGSERLLDLRITDYQETPALRMFPPLGAHTPASRIFRVNSFGTGSGFSRRIDRVVRIISNKSGPWLSSGMAFS